MLKNSAGIVRAIAAGVGDLGSFSALAGEADKSGHPYEKKYHAEKAAKDQRTIRPILEARLRYETVARDG